MGFLTLRPSVHESRGSVIIKTGFVAGLLSLFLNTTRVEVIPSRRVIVFSFRRAYFFTSHHTIHFRDVGYIDYTFDSMGTDWGLTSVGFDRHDQVESFLIAIVTKDQKRHPVCAFRGEGANDTGWIGLLGGDDLIDFSGTQENESLALAQYLAGLIGVTIGKPLDTTDMATCPHCGHPTSIYRKKCLYCGALVNGPDGAKA